MTHIRSNGQKIEGSRWDVDAATDHLILDLDSSVREAYGQRECSAYNSHFGCECYHPLFCFNQDDDLNRTLLCDGNVASVHE